MEAMRALILGGTGAMGSHLARLLSDQGFNVIVTSRSKSGMIDGIEYRTGNAKNLVFLKKLLTESWDSIIDFLIYSEAEFSERIGYILEHTHHYIFLSSSRVYNDSKSPITEDTVRLLDSSKDKEFLSTTEYSLTKARQENVLYSLQRKNWTIIRPYITYSENRLQLGTLEKEQWLYRAIRGKSIVFSKDIAGHFTTMTYGFDVAKCIVSLLNNPMAHGETFHITSDKANRWSEILDIYLDVIFKKTGKIPKVYFQDLVTFSTWNTGKYQIIYDRLFNRHFSNNKIKKFVDTSDFKHVETGLSLCLEKFLGNPRFKRINWKNEALMDRYCNEHTPLKDIGGLKQKLKYIIYRYFIRS